MVAHAFNPSTREAEADGFLSSRPAWSTEWVPRQPGATQRNSVSKNQTKKKKNPTGLLSLKSTNICSKLFHQSGFRDRGISLGSCLCDTLIPFPLVGVFNCGRELALSNIHVLTFQPGCHLPTYMSLSAKNVSSRGGLGNLNFIWHFPFKNTNFIQNGCSLVSSYSHCILLSSSMNVWWSPLVVYIMLVFMSVSSFSLYWLVVFSGVMVWMDTALIVS